MKGTFSFPTVCLALLLMSACGEKSTTPARQPSGKTAATTAPAPGEAKPDSSGNGGYGGYGSYYSAGKISFIDDVATNVDVGDEITSLSFVDVDGNETRLEDYVGQKSVVLVITRGNTDPICPYCTTQTSRLIFNYVKFEQRNAEVLVVYPIEHEHDKDRLASFLEASKKRLDDPDQPVPFPILLDVELTAVDQLGIRKDLSKPATYILDPEGHVRFAYVGIDFTDRPSIDAMVAELDSISSNANEKPDSVEDQSTGAEEDDVTSDASE